MSGAINRILSSAATKYLAWTVNNDPHAAKAFARPQSVLDSIKVLVGYFQVDNNKPCIGLMRLVLVISIGASRNTERELAAKKGNRFRIEYRHQLAHTAEEHDEVVLGSESGNPTAAFSCLHARRCELC
jgi:hypothetical protein